MASRDSSQCGERVPMADQSSRARSRSEPAAAIVPSSQRASSVEGSPGKSRICCSSAALYLAVRRTGQAQRHRAAACQGPEHAGLGTKRRGPGIIGDLGEHRVGFGELAGLIEKAAGPQPIGFRFIRLPECEGAICGERHLGACGRRVSRGRVGRGHRLPDRPAG